jgi:hypothetical protein
LACRATAVARNTSKASHELIEKASSSRKMRRKSVSAFFSFKARAPREVGQACGVCEGIVPVRIG